MMTEKEILRKNVKDLQRQLRDAYIRIKELNEKCNELRNRLGLDKEFTTAEDGQCL
tara:strand:+ start:100 stop:267 length:168 start_codon:yes stop_codon:yes gene_type:complete